MTIARLFPLVSLSWLFSACVSTSMIRPDDLPIYAGNEIVVTRNDGRQIRYDKSDYTIDSTVSPVVLRGIGHEYTNTARTQSRQFRDSIPIRDIVGVEVRQKTIFYYSGPIVFIALASIAVLGAIIWVAAGGGGFGG
jgi:hypothetical protein